MRRVTAWASVIALSFCASCIWETESKRKLDLGVNPRASSSAESAANRDTIGSLAYYQGLAPMRVRGHGLVVGLGQGGSTKCPKPVYDRLLQGLYKRHRFASGIVGESGITPEQMINDRDTAVVAVYGDIPPAAVAGDRFDLQVLALPGTDTKSLRGGRLYTAELELFRSVGEGKSIQGRIMAGGSGPVFQNPFSEGDAATHSNPLEGIIIGGGQVMEDRRVRLLLSEPSYPEVRRIQDRINAFVPGSFRAADALSPSIVNIRIPAAYREDTGHFLTLIRKLYLARDPQFNAMRVRELAKELVSPQGESGQIALCLEGIGREALPILDGLYIHSNETVGFYAAVAGLRLGDHVAGDTIIMHAENPVGRYRYQAIRALARAPGMAAPAMCLRRLLDDSDPRIQVAAYEALIRRRDPTVLSTEVGGDNFILDQIPSSRPNFIYAKRSGSRRLALFGSDHRCTPPVLYLAPDRSVTISAPPGAEELTLLRVVVSTGTSSPPISSPLTLPELVELLGSEPDVDLNGRATGLGLDYGSVVHVLYHLCKDGVINATFVLEQPNMTEMLGAPKTQGRPESEL